MKVLWCCCLLPVLASSCALAQVDDGVRFNARVMTGRAGEHVFLESAMTYTGAGVEWSRIAAQRGTHPDVKAFANELADADMKIAHRILDSGNSYGAQFQSGVDGKLKAESNRLTSLPADQVDAAYLTSLIKLQHAEVDMLMQESASTQDPDMKRMADSLTITLGRRNDKASALLKTIK